MKKAETRMKLHLFFFFFLLALSFEGRADGVFEEQESASSSTSSEDIPVMGKPVPVGEVKAEDDGLSYRRSHYQIDGRYKSGENLIYQCEFQYYACVDKDGWESCSLKREEEKTLKSKKYSCAPLKKFPTKTKCSEENYRVIESNAKKRFCYPK